VATTAMPGFLIPVATGASRTLKIATKTMGARTVASMWIGLIAKTPDQPVSPRTLSKARALCAGLAV